MDGGIADIVPFCSAKSSKPSIMFTKGGGEVLNTHCTKESSSLNKKQNYFVLKFPRAHKSLNIKEAISPTQQVFIKCFHYPTGASSLEEWASSPEGHTQRKRLLQQAVYRVDEVQCGDNQRLTEEEAEARGRDAGHLSKIYIWVY